MQILARQNHFGRINGHVEIEIHASPNTISRSSHISRSSDWEIYVMARQNHFGRINEYAEVEIHVSLMPYPGTGIFQDLVTRRYI
jgi:hypothetical protein